MKKHQGENAEELQALAEELGVGGDPTTEANRMHISTDGNSGYRRTAWGLLPEVLDDVQAYILGRWSVSKLQARFAEAQARAREPRAAEIVPTTKGAGGDGRSGNIAVIPLQGMITPRSSLLALLFGGGGGGLQGFRRQFREALNDQSVSTILLEVDSPGGLVDQVPETAAEVREARGGDKRIIAHSNVRCASAAYWIASQADELIVSPSGEVGSIGTLCFHEDVSEMEASIGIKTTIISAGKYKAEGNPYEPLSREARASLQGYVDALYEMFVSDVAEGRRTSAQAVKSGYGQGRLELAADAVQLGLADRVESFEATLLRLGAADEEGDELTEPSPEPEDEGPPSEEAAAAAHRAAGLLLLPSE